MPQAADPYRLTAEAIREPPRTLAGSLRHIGPGLILAGAIVGSGELIATTVLGAEYGYTLLWLILVSCAIKVVVQGEIGRYAVVTGETTLRAFNRAPGPRLRVAWPVWLWVVMVSAVMFSVGGMLGAIGGILHRFVPALPASGWIWVVDGVTVALLLSGRYGLVEKPSLALVATFTFVTAGAAVILLQNPEFFSAADLFEGLAFRMPDGGVATAATVFGATGVGAGELMMYPYWCLEKGYARFSGPPTGSPAWARRVRGWMRVMSLDVLCSLAIYTASTLAFYLLGAGVLAKLGVIPQGLAMVNQLSNIYTETLGSWSFSLFMAGAIAVFYSTIFSVTAAHGRLFADLLLLLGLGDPADYARRLLLVRVGIVVTTIAPTLCFFLVEEPVLMVMIGGVAQALMLPVIAGMTIYLTARRVPRAVTASPALRAALWATAGVMALAALYYLFRVASDYSA